MNRVCHFVDGTSGRAFRVSDLLAAVPTYVDLGVVDAGGLYWIALDEFDKEDTAMVCGPNGIWKTTNLSGAPPVWNQVLVTAAGTGVTMVLSSPVQQGLWMACGTIDPIWCVATVWWTTDGGAAWSSAVIGAADIGTSTCWLKMEVSSHDADVAWLSLYRAVDSIAIVHKTTDMWTGSTRYSTLFADCSMRGAYGSAPHSHHRSYKNSSDRIGVWGGIESTVGVARGEHFTSDISSSGTCYSLCTAAGVGEILWVGCYSHAINRWWALATCAGPVQKFYNSDDGTAWTEVHQFAGTTQHSAGWPDRVNEFVATNDGVVYPLAYSNDRGDTWTAKAGNWGALGHNGDIRCVAVGVLAPVTWNYTVVGGGLYPQSIDCNGDGSALYICLYDTATGQPALMEVALPLDGATSVGNIMFLPGAGTAINVKCSVVGDELAIAGDFAAANEQVETSDDAGITWTDIDRDFWGAEVAQPLIINPTWITEVMVALAGAQDITETFDAGATAWIVNNPAIGYSPGAMVRLVRGHEMIIGDDAANRIDYSPNRGVSVANVTGAFGGNVAALEIT